MTLVKIDDATEGMKLIAAVVNIRNQIVLPTGALLTGRSIERIKKFNIHYVEIDDSADESLSPEELYQMELQIDRVFTLNDYSHLQFDLVELKKMYAYFLRRQQPDSPVRHIDLTIHKDVVMQEKWTNTNKILEQSQELYSLSTVHRRLLSIMNKPDVSIADIGDLIQKDPSLAARLIRVANSAYYALSQKLETVSRAITLIGLNDLKSLIMASTLIEHFSKRGDPRVNMTTYWKHAIACGTLCRNIAKRLGEKDAERFFMMGLLHDIGKLIVYREIPDIYLLVEQNAFSQKNNIDKMERKIVGLSHGSLGEALLKQWNFSKTLQEVVATHHHPSRLQSHRHESTIVHLGDVLAHCMCHSAYYPSNIPIIDTEVLSELPLHPADWAAIVYDSDQQIEELCNEFLNQG